LGAVCFSGRGAAGSFWFFRQCRICSGPVSSLCFLVLMLCGQQLVAGVGWPLLATAFLFVVLGVGLGRLVICSWVRLNSGLKVFFY